MKAIYALIGVSLLMIVGGIALIVNQPPAPEEAPIAEETRDIGVIPAPAQTDSEIPQLDVEAEPGSEPWCDQMMNIPNVEWTREDSKTFADNCIYE
ncbi:DUF3012 domain-containing protein [Marinimicrobium agarilyticum]|uniref:DUF3012 domain-containing protein n=1 Tax=Marinimicrobium agarilyticum TaxID=306546 RepID=UPI0003FF684E|nr:DUF3012 domain-containing protein [Marinimicrobium agarilyticum]